MDHLHWTYRKKKICSLWYGNDGKKVTEYIIIDRNENKIILCV